MRVGVRDERVCEGVYHDREEEEEEEDGGGSICSSTRKKIRLKYEWVRKKNGFRYSCKTFLRINSTTRMKVISSECKK